MPAIPTTLTPCRPDDWLLITTSDQYWGKGPDIASAKQALMKAGSRSTPSFWHVYSIHKDARVNEFGSIVSPKDHSPMLTAIFDPGSKEGS